MKKKFFLILLCISTNIFSSDCLKKYCPCFCLKIKSSSPNSLSPKTEIEEITSNNKKSLLKENKEFLLNKKEEEPKIEKEPKTLKQLHEEYINFVVNDHNNKKINIVELEELYLNLNFELENNKELSYSEKYLIQKKMKTINEYLKKFNI